MTSNEGVGTGGRGASGRGIEADVVVVGAGLAGLVAAAQAYAAGRRVAVLDQEPEASVGGQAHWSFGGLFLVNTPEQRRLGVRDSEELALADWHASAGFDRPEDALAKEWAAAYVNFAAGEKRAWLASLGVGLFPLVQWAERGGYGPDGHGNTVPRFHVAWGTGPALVAPFLAKLREGEAAGRVSFHFRHRATELVKTAGRVSGVRGELLEASGAGRGESSSRRPAGSFEAAAAAVVVTSGGIGGNHDMVRRQWPGGAAPERMLSGVPASVDGDFLPAVGRAGGHLINGDRMWHYPEGIHNHAPVWPRHGIRILPGPSALWLDATGRMLPPPLFPGFDSLGALRHILATGHAHSWFVLNRTIALKEFALSGSEQNPDLTGKDVRLLAVRLKPGSDTPLQRFLDRGVDFLQAAGPRRAGRPDERPDGRAAHRPRGPGAADPRPGPAVFQRAGQGSAAGGDPGRTPFRHRQDHAGGATAPAAGSAARSAACRPALGPDAQEPRRPAHGSAVAGPGCRRAARARAVRRR